MDLVKLSAMVGVVFLLGLVAANFRCAFGWHPADGRRMHAGTSRGPDGRLLAEQVAQWECGACHRVVPHWTTRLAVSAAMRTELRRQIPAARARSKVIAMHVVRREDDVKEA